MPSNGTNAAIIAGVAMVVVPGLVVAPILGAAGFGASGIVGGSMAAGIQSGIGNVAAGSVFAGLQSAAMGGAASAVLNGAVQGAGVLLGTMGFIIRRNNEDNGDEAPEGEVPKGETSEFDDEVLE